ncbi:MAG: bifunctional ADP-dependent NAD(P)H-hydrate dehydratase/NAD(P)H-hydrate epimerase, partial [Lentisphaeria bacterium]|nr:bifunctional ADP-dependent NAD(P)H-hydrate dehydratase/NAD(P)H-hydrate epimerase [Lentisphaeria bacterium]
DAFVVLKGRGTLLAAPDGRITINTSGTTGLATAGSGDVLAGLLGGLLAQGFRPWDALRLGVFAHGQAAAEAPERDRALVADDLPSHIATVFRHLSPFA